MTTFVIHGALAAIFSLEYLSNWSFNNVDEFGFVINLLMTS